MCRSQDEIPKQILFCYSIEQSMYKEIMETIPNIIFHHGLPSLEYIYEMSGDKPLLIVLDDLSDEILKNDEMLLLFTQGSHHRRISIVFMNHNLYQQGKNSRTITLNVKYLVLFANPRDNLEISYLGRQLFPGNGKQLREAFMDSTGTEWGYLLIDMNPQTAI